MPLRRIHIIGGPGSGKSFAAARLAELCGVSVTNLDDLFWNQRAGGYNVQAPVEERMAALECVFDRKSWIIEGVYYSWLERSFREADAVLVMNVPVWLRDWRIMRRFLRRKLGVEQWKGESVVEVGRLVRWNHAYDRSDLVAARETFRRIGRSVTDCRSIMDVLRATDTPASQAMHPVWLKISAVSTLLQSFRLGVYWMARFRWRTWGTPLTRSPFETFCVATTSGLPRNATRAA
jgi:adenylate kinase family enzyme